MSLPERAMADYHAASSSTSNLCEVIQSVNCRAKRPKYVESNGFAHPYCGRGCADLRNTQTRGRSPQRSNPTSAAVQQSPAVPPSTRPVLFYHRDDPHFGFTNFSDHPVEYDGAVYPTSEHLFQAFKFINSRPDVAEQIRKCETSRQAFDLAHRHQSDVRADWYSVNIAKMDKVLRLKFEQHLDLRQELLDTGDAPLVEASIADAFWGFGADGKGRNQLGKALMRLRDSYQGR
ncbi:DUF1768-domain-containing protein [Dentipellis sp. KUC8613]|nr:DUF1768-domain-containing protein [Dentipellis sp. KUC8613]